VHGEAIIEAMQLDLMVKGAADPTHLRPHLATLRNRLDGRALSAVCDELAALLADSRIASSPALYESILERLETLNRGLATPDVPQLPLLAYDFDVGPRVMRTFADEATEHLDSCERGLLALERQPGNRAVVDELFRNFHSLKGETATVGLTALRAIAHTCEDMLLRVRNGGAHLRSSEIDHVLRAVDVLRAAIQRINEHLVDATRGLPVMPSGWHDWRGGPAQPTTATLPSIVGEPAATVAAAATGEAEPATPVSDTTVSESTASDTTVAETTASETTVPIATASGTHSSPRSAIPVQDVVVGSGRSFPAIDPSTVAWLLAQAELGGVLVSANRNMPAGFSRAENSTHEPTAQQAVRVSVERIDVASGQVATALMLTQQISLLTEEMTQALGRRQTGNDQLGKRLEQLGSLLRQMQASCLAMRLVRVAETFDRVRRTARDIARQLGKRIEVRIHGEEVEIDKTILDALASPLTHLIRNALDHGMETSEARVAAGKEPVGTITLEARQEGGRVVIELADDGRGINLDRVRARAQEIGLLQPTQQPAREELIALIFLPGFSTAKEVSDMSGRGVGMDVVRQEVQSLGGNVEVRTEAGKFTSFSLHLPISMALQETLLIRVGIHEYLVPQNALVESVRLRHAVLGRVRGIGRLLDWRGAAIPLLCLHDFAGGMQPPTADMTALIVRQGTQAFALAVDDVIGMRQVLIRPLGDVLARLRGFIGGSLMEDGRVLLVLDPLDAMRAILGRGLGHGAFGTTSQDAQPTSSTPTAASA